MKNSKFWIWFIPLLLIATVGIFCLLKKNTNNTPVNNTNNQVNLIEEYKNGNSDYYEVNLNDSHVYKNVTNDELKELLDKDGLIFIGDTNSNVARKNLVVLNNIVLSTSIPQVYYINKNDINDELKNLLNKKINNTDIKSGTLISLEKGNVLKVYYPNFVVDNKELLEGEKILLEDAYKEIVNKFIEACDENC